MPNKQGEWTETENAEQWAIERAEADRATGRRNVRVIFLDFDGVVNTPETWGRFRDGDGREALDVDKVTALYRLCEEMDAFVVVSSTWRVQRSVEQLATLLEVRGFQSARARVIGVTPASTRRGMRGAEILAWLAEHPEVSSFVAVDDADEWMDGVRHRYVQTDPEQGITAETIDAMRVQLNRRARNRRHEERGR